MKQANGKKYIFISTTFLAGGILIGNIFLPHIFYKDKPSSCPKDMHQEERQGMRTFTNPLLECEMAEESLTNPLGVSKFEIQKLINSKLESGEADHISFYFRDLNNGPWVGIKEKEEFLGGSLLKVPLMIAYLKEAESNPGLLNKKIKYGEINPQVSLSQFFATSKEIKLGNEYTAEELIEYMIKYSDNNAADLLGQNIGPDKIVNVFSALGIGFPDFNKPYPVSTRTYASFFRILFNSSYLSIEMSEKALAFLSHAEFSQGIRAGTPSDISIAHKFGIREVDNSGKQLHDCGIIYYPKHPYVLCIMTKGSDFDKLAKTIADISKEIYKQISYLDSGGGFRR